MGSLSVAAWMGAVVASVALASSMVLPSGWRLQPPPLATAATGLMPQAARVSPDGRRLAITESGFANPALSLYDVRTLKQLQSIHLPDAYGRPVWVDESRILVAGASSDAIFEIDLKSSGIRRIAFPKNSDPLQVAALPNGQFAVACDGDSSVRIGTLERIGSASPIKLRGRLGDIAVSGDGQSVFVSIRSESAVALIRRSSTSVSWLPTRLHPYALLVRANTLYIAEADSDSVASFRIDTRTFVSRVHVGLRSPATGSSPNALLANGEDIYVSLGAANAIAVLKGGNLQGFLPAGRYPTDIAVAGSRLIILDGKGEISRPNPRYDSKDKAQYIATLEKGSLRAIPLSRAPYANLSFSIPKRDRFPDGSPLYKGGPIKHVFIVLKENRSYDQVFGDIKAGRGDPNLAWFGRRVTPNEHALAQQYGLLDNAYATGEVSAVGHLWMDAAFANDYAERTWPLIYGGRRIDDLTTAERPAVPSAGFLWEAARRAHVSFRDYGEMVFANASAPEAGASAIPSLRGLFDAHYVGWNLSYSDLSREKEWQREFAAHLRTGTVPSLELIWLPNDHTAASKPQMRTPNAYVATNDLAVGRLVYAVSHSSVWKSSVIFVTEDDAQDGPDHVDAQRTVLLVISPYSKPGSHHAHYSTVNILRTTEVILGIPPLSAYDATARPMYEAFQRNPSAPPFIIQRSLQNLNEINSPNGYAAAISAKLDFGGPDRVPGGLMRAILAHNHVDQH